MSSRLLAILIGVSFFFAQSAASADEAGPRVVHVSPVAADVLGLTVESGRLEYGQQEPYRPEPGDEVREDGPYRSVWLVRGGKHVGALVGKERKVLWRFDRFTGPDWDAAWSARPESFRISSTDDQAYRAGTHPLAVHRKSKPTDMGRVGPWDWAFPVRHVLYLRLGAPLKPGCHYRVEFPGGRLAAADFTHDPARCVSEAVHVNQLGFRPDDPRKVAFLSCWLGDGGKLEYREGLAFRVVDDRTGRAVHEGKTTLARAATEPEDPYKKNYNLVDVYAMDFSGLAAPGTYRVLVEGVGSSRPFVIGADVYRRAFVVAARGFYHQRSGIALGPPYTEYHRPRCFHPDDGQIVYESTCPLMASGNGLNVLGTDQDNFGNLVAGKTERLVANAWGGYFDAGDWDRRIQHLDATRLLLELVDLFPAYFEPIGLDIPESNDDLPDVINEALWNLDCYRRMQTTEGGIRGGIESAEHPRTGEGSWQESLPVMAYAPDPWCSYLYAGVAARAARLLSKKKPELADIYRQSAMKAMRWGEGELPKWDGRMKQNAGAVRDARNLAALELYRLTGEAVWHELFLETTVLKDPKTDLFVWQDHDTRHAAFLYATLPTGDVRQAIQKNARAATLREADVAVEMTGQTGFRWAKDNPWAPVQYGTLGGPNAVTLMRAYKLSGDAKYLAAAVLACQYGLGANPANVTMTTGLGHEWPRHPLVVDARMMAADAPPGITVFGPMDMVRNSDQWTLKLMKDVLHPAAAEWPTTEAWFDVYLMPEVTEFTVQSPMAQTAYVWGWLAARGSE